MDEIILPLYEICLCDNLVFQWLHWRNQCVVDVGVGVDVCASGSRGGSGGGLKPKFVFSVIILIELFMLNLTDTGNIFQVIFELFIYELHKILSRHLILHVKFRLHFIQERLLDCVGAFFACHASHCGCGGAGSNVAGLRHHLSACFYRQRNTVTVYITEIIAVAAWNDGWNTCITHPFAVVAFIIEELGFGCSEFVGTESTGTESTGTESTGTESTGTRFDVFFYFYDGVVSIIDGSHSWPHHNCFRLLLRFFI